jgi:hypothetical protein
MCPQPSSSSTTVRPSGSVVSARTLNGQPGGAGGSATPCLSSSHALRGAPAASGGHAPAGYRLLEATCYASEPETESPAVAAQSRRLDGSTNDVQVSRSAPARSRTWIHRLGGRTRTRPNSPISRVFAGQSGHSGEAWITPDSGGFGSLKALEHRWCLYDAPVTQLRL